jgi:AraC-like DNA-binding protein
MDVLSDVLHVVRLAGAIFYDVEALWPWAATTPDVRTFKRMVMPESEHVITFHVVIHGTSWAELADGSAPGLRLSAGDVLIIPDGQKHTMASDPRLRFELDPANYYRPTDRSLPLPFVLNEGGGPERTHFMCGYLGCDSGPFNPLLEALPGMFKVRISEATQAWLTSLVRVAVDETGQRNAGGEAMLARLAELMFVEVIRRYVEDQPQDARGWLTGLRDRHVSAALRLIHGRPSEPWTLDTLARSIGLSRSAFAEHFTYLVGVPPMQYLARWRLQIASHLLENGRVGIAAAAEQVGYQSESAFNRAFKRFVGLPPGAWRRGRTNPRDGIQDDRRTQSIAAATTSPAPVP